MKELVKSSRVIGYLEMMYRQLNADMFGGELQEVVITVSPSKGAYGHVTCSKIWRVKEDNRYELNMSADWLSRPIENVVSTLLHEMVHIYNLQHDIQDCSRGNTYHNKKFKEKAENVGLVIGYDKTIGYSLTSPSIELIEYIVSRGWSDILINRGGVFGSGSDSGINGGSGSGDSRKPKSSTRKYMCPKCNMSVRATREVNILCGDCNVQMAVV